MRLRVYQGTFWFILASLVACGGSGSSGTGGGSAPPSITFTFVPNVYLGLGLSTGMGAFAPVTLQNNQLTFTVPSATAKYAIAMNCTQDPSSGDEFETVFEATPQDGTTFFVDCNTSPHIQPGNPPPPPPALGNATGSLDASAILGAIGVAVYATGPQFQPTAISGSFGVTAPTGTDDVALVAYGSSGNDLAVKILRGQMVPGVLNGGNTITLSSGDLLTTQPLSITNVPPGFSPQVIASYTTAAGTQFFFNTNDFPVDLTQYPAVPAAATQTGDSYGFLLEASDTATHNSSVSIGSTIAHGGPVTLGPLPSPWSYSGPTAAAFPTFAFDTYSGFAGQMPS